MSKLGVRNKELPFNEYPEVTHYILPPPKPLNWLIVVSFLPTTKMQVNY